MRTTYHLRHGKAHPMQMVMGLKNPKVGKMKMKMKKWLESHVRKKLSNKSRDT
jgi:hypothetical protein